MKTLATLFFAVFLTGCSALGIGDAEVSLFDVREKLGSVLQADLDAAIADAEAHNDTIAATCYKGIKDYLARQASPAVDAPQGGGIISLYQRGRNVNQAKNQQPPPELKMACSALVVDGQQFLAKMALMATPAGGASNWWSNLWPF